MGQSTNDVLPSAMLQALTMLAVLAICLASLQSRLAAEVLCTDLQERKNSLTVCWS